MPNLADVAHFFDDVAKRIKANDPLHLVNSGGSGLRGCQWNQYTKHAWIRDTVDEQNKALDLLYAKSAIDIIDVHYYTGNASMNLEGTVKGKRGEEVPMNVARYMDSSTRIGKPLMIGEAGASAAPAIIGDWNLVHARNNPKYKKLYEATPDYFDTYADPNAVKWVKIYCDELVAGGAQLSYWWAYSSNRDVDAKNPICDIKKGRTDPALAVIIDANKRLKAKLGAQ